jgi:hypothetical protein
LGIYVLRIEAGPHPPSPYPPPLAGFSTFYGEEELGGEVKRTGVKALAFY